jgi:hypothetical protein
MVEIDWSQALENCEHLGSLECKAYYVPFFSI